MNDMQFVDQVPIAGARITTDGYLVAEVNCARVGCQNYLASDVGLDGGGLVSVFRPEETVFARDSLATFAGKPVTVGHPPVMVTADNWKQYAVGDIGTDIARDGEYVRVQIKLMDAAAIKAVMDGTREISMGYTTGLKLQDGIAPDGTPYRAVQTGPIRINHLAVVPLARGGSQLRIGDDAADLARWGASPVIDRKDANMADVIQTRTVMIDGLSVVTTDAGAQAIEKLQRQLSDAAKDFEKKFAAAEEDKDKKMAAKDAEIATLTKQLGDTKALVLDAAALDKLIADRATLVTRAKALAPAVVTDGKSPAEIKKAVVLATRGAEMADKSEAYIDAAFDLLNDVAADPLKGKVLVDSSIGTRDASYDAYRNSFAKQEA